MIIQHNGVVIGQFEQSHNILETLNLINQEMNMILSQGQVVTDIIIDGMDVTGMMESYIESNHDHIKTIGINSVSREEMFTSLYRDTIEYMTKVERATDSISDLFYGEPDEEAWSYLAQLTEGLQFSIQSLQMIGAHLTEFDTGSTLPEMIEKFISEVEMRFGEMDQAMQESDNVLLADIIKYELGELVSQMLADLESKVNV